MTQLKNTYSENPAMFKDSPLMFILSLILIPAFGVGLIILLVWYLKSKSTKLTVSADSIVLEKGLLSKERCEVNMSSVRTTKVMQSFFNRIFGVGRIEIYTAGDSPEIVASGLPDPNTIREIIKANQHDHA